MIKFILRCLVGAALLYVLLHFDIIDFAAISGLWAEPQHLAIGITALLLTFPIAGLRWNLLLRAQDIKAPLGQTIQLVTAASFFNTFLPGAFGGDIVRGAYVMQASNQRRTRAMFSLLLDRISGLFGLVTLGTAAAVVNFSPRTAAVEWAMIVVGIGFTCALLGLLLLGPMVMRWLGKSTSWLGERVQYVLAQLTDGIEASRRYWPSLIASWCLSILIYLLAIAGLLQVVKALGIGSLNNMGYSIAAVWSLIANSIPLTPGGIGIGEAAFARVCYLLETEPSGAAYATIFLAYRGLTALATLPAGLAYITYSHRPFSLGDTGQEADRQSRERQ